MSYGVLHGEFQRSHGPLRALEDVVMNIIFSVLQSGCMNQCDTKWLIWAWTTISLFIPKAVPHVTFTELDKDNTPPTTPDDNGCEELPATGTHEPPTLPTPQSNSSDSHKHSGRGSFRSPPPRGNVLVGMKISLGSSNSSSFCDEGGYNYLFPVSRRSFCLG